MIHAKDINNYIKVLPKELYIEFKSIIEEINKDFTNNQILSNSYRISNNKFLKNKIQFFLLNYGYLCNMEEEQLIVSTYRPYKFAFL